jgi:hypothetical protein
MYLSVGLVVAGFTVGMFPPSPGYKPPLHIVVSAIAVYALLWPFLILMCLGYLSSRLYCRWLESETVTLRPRAPQFHYRVLYDDAHSRN